MCVCVPAYVYFVCVLENIIRSERKRERRELRLSSDFVHLDKHFAHFFILIIIIIGLLKVLSVYMCKLTSV